MFLCMIVKKPLNLESQNWIDDGIDAQWSGIDFWSKRLKVKVARFKSVRVPVCAYRIITMLVCIRWWPFDCMPSEGLPLYTYWLNNATDGYGYSRRWQYVWLLLSRCHFCVKLTVIHFAEIGSGLDQFMSKFVKEWWGIIAANETVTSLNESKTCGLMNRAVKVWWG